MRVVSVRKKEKTRRITYHVGHHLVKHPRVHGGRRARVQVRRPTLPEGALDAESSAPRMVVFAVVGVVVGVVVAGVVAVVVVVVHPPVVVVVDGGGCYRGGRRREGPARDAADGGGGDASRPSRGEDHHSIHRWCGDGSVVVDTLRDFDGAGGAGRAEGFFCSSAGPRDHRERIWRHALST